MVKILQKILPRNQHQISEAIYFCLIVTFSLNQNNPIPDYVLRISKYFHIWVSEFCIQSPYPYWNSAENGGNIPSDDLVIGITYTDGVGGTYDLVIDEACSSLSESDCAIHSRFCSFEVTFVFLKLSHKFNVHLLLICCKISLIFDALLFNVKYVSVPMRTS